MLVNRTFLQRRATGARRQGGMVMLVSLIVLVVMAMAGIGLMRSMDTSTTIAGNMAFKQAATQAADTGLETAIAWLEQNNASSNLNNPIPGNGYSANSGPNTDYPLGEAFWAKVEPAGVCNLNRFGQGCITTPPEANANGNKVSYSIQRLCKDTGAVGAGCAAVAGTVSASGGSEGAQDDQLSVNNASAYYRITVRVQGPRNTVSYVQSIVSL